MTESSRSVINGLIQAFDLLRSYFSERTSSVLRANGKQWLEDALNSQILDRSYGSSKDGHLATQRMPPPLLF